MYSAGVVGSRGNSDVDEDEVEEEDDDDWEEEGIGDAKRAASGGTSFL